MQRCGYVALVGRPNVGKSTLLNRLLGQKISITAGRPQTTRHRILGIKTVHDTQCVYVDTPGIHLGRESAINRYMNRAASTVLADVDVVVFVVEALAWTNEDEHVLERLRQVHVPVLLAVNKADKVKDKERLLPFIEQMRGRFEFEDIVPLSAATGENVQALEQIVERGLPEGPHLFPADQVTDRTERFLAAELVREKITRTMRQELPYGVTVSVERFAEKDEVLHISAIVWVERKGQKAIVIGKAGEMLKKIGRKARIDMERMFGQRVFLQLWVKVKEGWSDDERSLRELGYSDE